MSKRTRIGWLLIGLVNVCVALIIVNAVPDQRLAGALGQFFGLIAGPFLVIGLLGSNSTKRNVG